MLCHLHNDIVSLLEIPSLSMKSLGISSNYEKGKETTHQKKKVWFQVRPILTLKTSSQVQLTQKTYYGHLSHA
jgi:hypothetical protein